MWLGVPAARCARVLHLACPQRFRGRRESRVPIAPVGPVQQKSTGVGPQVNRSNAGFPCAMVYGLLRALPGVPGVLATVARELVTRELDPSVGGSGPHDFAVRELRRSSNAQSASIASRYLRP
jgi:hypothetical protein